MRITDQVDRIPYTAPAEVSPGDLVVLGDMVGVAESRIPAGTTGTLTIRGEFTLPRLAVFADWQVGQACYWSPGSGGVTSSPTSNIALGVISEFSKRTDTRAKVILL